MDFRFIFEIMVSKLLIFSIFQTELGVWSHSQTDGPEHPERHWIKWSCETISNLEKVLGDEDWKRVSRSVSSLPMYQESLVGIPRDC